MTLFVGGSHWNVSKALAHFLTLSYLQHLMALILLSRRSLYVKSAMLRPVPFAIQCDTSSIPRSSFTRSSCATRQSFDPSQSSHITQRLATVNASAGHCQPYRTMQATLLHQHQFTSANRLRVFSCSMLPFSSTIAPRKRYKAEGMSMWIRRQTHCIKN